MNRIIKIGKTLRNNWKKSTVGFIALCYAGSSLKEKYEITLLMEAACKEASLYGESLIPVGRNPTVVTVILNPVANKRKSKKDFEKYCEPLLHLAGLQVNVVPTTSEGNAKEIVENLRGTEAIVVAGGDGTLSETVTGLLRRNDGANQFPIGVLPLGRTNTFGDSMFPSDGNTVARVKQLIDASMAIIKWNTEWKDAMKIEPIPENDDEVIPRPIYALSSIQWGAFRDTIAKKDKYWFLGSLRDYAAFIFNGYKNSLTWDCSGTIKYSPPCSGCSNCVQRRPEIKRAWSFFTSTQSNKQLEDPAKLLNPVCSSIEELCFKACEFQINFSSKDSVPSLNLILGKNKYSYTEFVSEGWRRLRGKYTDQKVVPARTIELRPREPNSDKEVLEIDSEEYDVKPVKVTLLPKTIRLFCLPQLNYQN